MAQLTHRNEYYWNEGRVVPLRSYKDDITGRWRRLKGRRGSLIATVMRTNRGFEVRHGPAYSLDRIATVMSIEEGMPINGGARNLGLEVPLDFLQAVRTRVELEVQRTLARRVRLSAEDRVTGFFFGNLDGEFTASGWRARIRHQNFSSIVKEPIIGADVGVIIDLLDEATGRRVVKCAWFQAKLADDEQYQPRDLPDLQQQMDQMHGRTPDAYAVVYGPESIRVYSPAFDEALQPGTVLADMIACGRGDRNPAVLIDTLDARFILTALVTHLEHPEPELVEVQGPEDDGPDEPDLPPPPEAGAPSNQDCTVQAGVGFGRTSEIQSSQELFSPWTAFEDDGEAEEATVMVTIGGTSEREDEKSRTLSGFRRSSGWQPARQTVTIGRKRGD